MATVFHLIRHAHTDFVGRALAGRLPGVILTAAGRRDADRLADSLAHHRLAAIVASPRERAQQTAAPLAARLGQAVRVEAGLDEIDYGLWTGAEIARLDGTPEWRAYNVFRSTAPIPGGETALAVQARAVAALRHLQDEFPAAELAVVSHADVLRAALAHFLGVPLDLARRIDVAPAHRAVLMLDHDDARIDALNLPP